MEEEERLDLYTGLIQIFQEIGMWGLEREVPAIFMTRVIESLMQKYQIEIMEIKEVLDEVKWNWEEYKKEYIV